MKGRCKREKRVWVCEGKYSIEKACFSEGGGEVPPIRSLKSLIFKWT